MPKEELLKFIVDLLNTSTANILFGILGTLSGVFLNNYFTKKEAKRAEKESIKAFLHSISTETFTLWDLYLNKGVGSTLEETKDNEPFLYFYIAEQNYFIVYDKNTNILGKIENCSLRKSIVRTYIKAKSLLDTYSVNNKTLREYEELDKKYIETSKVEYKTYKDKCYTLLIKQTPKLKELHEDVKNEICLLQIEIEKYIKAH